MNSIGKAALVMALVACATFSTGLAQEVQEISNGEEVQLKDYLVAGKTTVFDFFSPYCPPCQELAPHMEKLAEKRADLAIVKVNINRPDAETIDWDSPVAKQYSLHSVPFMMIYDGDGKLVVSGPGARKRVAAWIAAAEKEQ